MRILLIWAVLALLLSTGAQPIRAQEHKSILAVLEAQQKAWNRGDLEAFMEGYWRSDSLLFVGSRGPAFGWQTTLDNYRKSYPDRQSMGILTFEVLRLEPLGEQAANMVGSWQLVRTSDTLRGYFTLIWRRIDGRWVITQDHSS